MKYIAVSAITASLVSIFISVGLSLLQKLDERPSSASSTEDSVLFIKESIAELKTEIDQIRREVGHEGHPVNTEYPAEIGIEYQDLQDRMHRVEAALETLLLAGSAPEKTNGEIVKKQLPEKFRQSAEKSQVSQSQDRSVLAENDFELDSGKPLGDFRASIVETLHSAEGIEVSGMVCGDTICKVSYLSQEFAESQEESDNRAEFVDKLAEAALGAEVKVRYVAGPSGNADMYIQLR